MVQLATIALGATLVAPGILADLVPRTWDGQQYGCKCYVGDDCWPKPDAWKALNATVGGNLHVHVPPEAACHDVFSGTLGNVSTYDAAKCAEVKENWEDEQWT